MRWGIQSLPDSTAVSDDITMRLILLAPTLPHQDRSLPDSRQHMTHALLLEPRTQLLYLYLKQDPTPTTSAF